MPDGVRLAARLWRPRTDQPVPAIVEYIPYRKADMVRARDERNHPFLAHHGFAAIRVDMRGSGDSDGQMPDMYAPAELDDARRVIDWLAVQPWCNGRVGMFGTSWGGTAALQASVNAPDALKAVIAVCATHDRFEDDIHHMGGCVLTDTFEWGATLPAILASPPTPNRGADWLEHWRRRVEALEFPLESWLRERGRGAYWRYGAVIHQADALSVPILSVGGWSDRYSSSVMSLVDARPDLVWGLVGPWGHHYPDHGAPGPGIGFQHLALDWWDHWLRPETTGKPDWPRLRVWLGEFDPPSDSLDQRQGRWVQSGPAEAETSRQIIDLAEWASPDAPAPWPVPNEPGIGVTSGDTGYFGRPGGLPLDQGDDDSRALVFESAPLVQDLILYGPVTVAFQGQSSTGKGQIVARLNDITPDGQAARIAYGIRKIALDDALDHPDVPLAPGSFDARLQMHNTAYRIRKGHRLRLAVSGALWPLICLRSPDDALRLEKASLTLPVLTSTPVALDRRLPPAIDLPFDKTHETLQAATLERWHRQDGTDHEIGWYMPWSKTHYAQTRTSFGYATRMTHRLQSNPALVQRIEITHDMRFDRPDGTTDVASHLTARLEDGTWHVEASIRVRWNSDEIGARRWALTVPE